MTTYAPLARRLGASLLAAALGTSIVTGVVLVAPSPASAAVVAVVPLGTASEYAVLGASTVTNTGSTVLNGSLGLSPGTAITGFPPGTVVPPGTTNAGNAAAQQAQSDLTAAYVNAAGRSLDATVAADLGNLSLQAGVYAAPGKGALSLTGPLVLDGAGDASSVFVFQTNSTLVTASASTISLINGAQECNVFWQVGSSATLGTGSIFSGNILALTSITVTNGVTVRGRALARNGAVTLDNDTFTRPTCIQQVPTTTTSSSTTTTSTTSTTSTTAAPTTTTTTPSGTTIPSGPVGPAAGPSSPPGGTPTGSSGGTPRPGGPTVGTLISSGPTLPVTGTLAAGLGATALVLLFLGLGLLALGRRRQLDPT